MCAVRVQHLPSIKRRRAQPDASDSPADWQFESAVDHEDEVPGPSTVSYAVHRQQQQYRPTTAAVAASYV